jgi:uncharacterized protein with GYD domain
VPKVQVEEFYHAPVLSSTNLIFHSWFVYLGDLFLLNACVLIRTSHGRFEDVVRTVSRLKCVKRVFPTLGRYDVVVDLEASNFKELGGTVLRMGNIAGVVFTETLVEIKH